MAYYPLKVKDSGGTVHTVGDPRTSNKADLASPTFTGTPAAPTAAVDTNTTQVATTAFVVGQAASATPVMDGSAAVGTSTRFARADHVHASDTSKASTTHAANHQSGGSDALSGLKSSQVPTIDTTTPGAYPYTLALSDAGKTVLMASGSAQTLTIPTNTTAAFPIGTKIDIIQTGAGACSIAPVDGTVTLNSDTSKRTINVQYAAATLLKTNTNEWVLIGALKA